MEKLNNKIAEKIALELQLDDNKKEVIAYGTFGLIQMIFSIGLVVAFALIFSVVKEALIISFTSAILRKYSGGVHASTPSRCAVIGTATTIGQAIIISFFMRGFCEIENVFLIGIIIFSLSYYLISKLAPVGSKNKSIKNEAKRERMKKKSIQLLILYLVIVIIMILLFIMNGWKAMLLYSFCIYSGILTQVITLTTLGHRVIGCIDAFFNHILFIKKG